MTLNISKRTNTLHVNHTLPANPSSISAVKYETVLRLVLSNLLVRDDWFDRWFVASYVYNQQDSRESGKTSEIAERHLVCCNLRKRNNKMAFFSCVTSLKGQSGCFGEEMMLIWE